MKRLLFRLVNTKFTGIRWSFGAILVQEHLTTCTRHGAIPKITTSSSQPEDGPQKLGKATPPPPFSGTSKQALYLESVKAGNYQKDQTEPDLE